MHKRIFVLALFFYGCGKSNSTQQSSVYGTYSYDATYNPPSGVPQNFSFNDTSYEYHGQQFATLSAFMNCTLTISQRDTTTQSAYSYFIGSYYTFDLGNGTLYANQMPNNFPYGYIVFSIPTDHFSSIYDLPVNQPLSFKGGPNSFYGGVGGGWIRLSSQFYFSPVGVTSSGLGPGYQDIIDSGNVNITITRFSDNGIHPNNQVSKTMDGNFAIDFYGNDGSSFIVTNGIFKNALFQIINP